MTFSRLALGKKGEGLALTYLKRKGYEIIEKNYRTNAGEIDIIGRDRDCVCFVEIRTRKTRKFGSPLESIDRKKQNQIAKTALIYIKNNRLEEGKCRFDVVSVEQIGGFLPNIKLIKNAFELNTWYKY